MEVVQDTLHKVWGNMYKETGDIDERTWTNVRDSKEAMMQSMSQFGDMKFDV